MKKAILTVLIAGILTGCSATTEKKEQIPAPFHTVETLAEAEKETGIQLQVPEEFAGASTMEYLVYDESMIEVLYEDADGNTILCIRKMSGNIENLAGDYNEYQNTKQNNGITLKENNDLVYVAEWKTTDASYAVSADEGMSEAEILAIVQNIQ